MSPFRSGRALPASRSRRRRGRRTGLVALGLAGGYIVLGTALFVLPQRDPLPHHADVAVVLGFPERPRIEMARELLARGVVGSVLISAPASQTNPDAPDVYWARLCAGDPRMTCAVARPFTTQGEARMLRTFASQHRWSSAVVITQTAHLTRARMLFARCFTGKLTMQASGEPPQQGWAFQFAYQTAAGLKAIAAGPSC